MNCCNLNDENKTERHRGNTTHPCKKKVKTKKYKLLAITLLSPKVSIVALTSPLQGKTRFGNTHHNFGNTHHNFYRVLLSVSFWI